MKSNEDGREKAGEADLDKDGDGGPDEGCDEGVNA